MADGLNDIDLRGEIALVTGAAHGIGRSVSRELARRGARVHAWDILGERVAETARLAQEAADEAGRGGSCVAAELDVTDPAAVSAAVARVREAEGRIDAAVHVAGGVAGQVGRPVEEVSDEDWAVIQKINLWGAFYLVRAVAPHMKERRRGRIVIISSGAGRTVSLTGIQSYASAKAGAIGFTRQMAFELGPWNITVNCVAPGFILSNPSTERQWASYGPERQRALVESIPLRRLGRPEDITHAVLFLVSPLAEWVTGQTLGVDGGRTLV